MKGIDPGNSLERKDSTKSNTTDTSSTHSTDSSPKLRSNKRKFIKNIKPETLKRPSFSVSNPEVTKLIDKPDCNLVGYKKVPNQDSYVVGSPGIHEAIVPPVELGTFSPAPLKIGDDDSSTHGALQGAISMPTLLAKGHLKLHSSGSMPDLSGGLSSSPNGTPSSGSEPNLTGNRNKTVVSACTNSGKTIDACEKSEPPGHQRRASKVSFTEPEATNKCDESLTEISFTGTDNTSDPPSYDDCLKVTVTEATPKHDNKQDVKKPEIDYKDLANCLTQALGEPEEFRTEEETEAKDKKIEDSSDSTAATSKKITASLGDASLHNDANVKASNKDQENVHKASDVVDAVVSNKMSDSERTCSDTTQARKLSNDSSSGDGNQFTVLELLRSEFDKNEASNNTASTQSSNSDLMKNGLIWPDNDSDESANSNEGQPKSSTTPAKQRPATADGVTPCASSSSDTMLSKSDVVKTRHNGVHLNVSHSVPELGALNSKQDSKLVSPVGIKTLR